MEYEAQLNEPSRQALPGLKARAAKLQQENDAIKGVLGALYFYGEPPASFAVFLWERIKAHIAESDAIIGRIDRLIEDNDLANRKDFEDLCFSMDSLKEDVGGLKGYVDGPVLLDRTVDFPVALKAAVGELAGSFNGVSIKLEDEGQPPPASLAISQDDLKEALKILFDNARKVFATTVTVSAKYTDEAVILSVVDNGPAQNGTISKEFKDLINGGIQFTGKRAGLGSGAGLMVVRELVEKHSGDDKKAMQVESAGKETTFTLRFTFDNGMVNAQAAGQPSIDQAQMNGGIDVSDLNVTRSAKSLQVFFDPAELAGFSTAGFKGFQPVIVGFAPASSVLSALGL